MYKTCTATNIKKETSTIQIQFNKYQTKIKGGNKVEILPMTKIVL